MKRWMMLLVVTLPLIATAAPPRQTADLPHQRSSENGVQEPARILRDAVTALTSFSHEAKGHDEAALRRFLGQQVLPIFDFERMAYWAMGRAARTATPQQQQEITIRIREEFTQMLVTRLQQFKGEHIEYLKPRKNRNGNVILALRAVDRQQQRPPITLLFKLHQRHDGWKIFDVVANGYSVINYFRQQLG
ncbi:MAG: ABC transporter substrate-binding protein [Gammaproteobacteria bacterium]|nr:ABC transporter substrate-binding protein [Gammaproteobacteria bacterium]